MDINDLTKERQQELDEIYKEEIVSLKENKITREEFIKIIRMKTTSILDIYYLINKYVRRVIIVDSILENIKESLSSEDIYFVTEDTFDITYSAKQKTPNVKHLKKIKKYKDMKKTKKYIRRERWKKKCH